MRVMFLPDGKGAEVHDGTPVIEAAVQAGVRLIAPCNGKGSCGKCGIQFIEGIPPELSCDENFFTHDELKGGWRLACLHQVRSDAVVFAAPATLGKVAFGPSMAGVELNPNVRKVYSRILRIRGDVLTWNDVVASAEKPVHERPTLASLKSLADLSFQSGMEVTVVVRGGEVVRLEEGDTRLQNFGLALDIGTTTVCASLMDLNTGEEIIQDAALNRQSVYGADVMSRLTAAHDDPRLVQVLQKLAAETVNEILQRMLPKAGVTRASIYEVAVVGNSCMHHIFLGINPLSLAYAPYDARVLCSLAARAADLGLDLEPDAGIYVLPNVASFIGADALGATLATGLHKSDGIRCLVDIGTNGEIMLGGSKRLIACSTPAGPAFEGAAISCGMIASDGAIYKVSIARDVATETIGGSKPRGLAGSGLIDACSELRKTGLVNETGKFVQPAGLPSLSPALASRLVNEDGIKFVLARSYGKAISLSQRDLREMQLAKGVIIAGIRALMAEMGIEEKDIEEINLAGTFGSYLNVENARTIGLVPHLPVDRIRAVGNAALVGAKMCLLSMEKRAEAEELATAVEHMELPTRPDFQDIFTNAMVFPPIRDTEEKCRG